MKHFLCLLTACIAAATSTYASLNSDLFAYWNFDETSGTTASDYTNNNDGTLSGDTEWVSGKFGNALDFDGTNDHVSAGTGNPVGAGNTMTISLWATADSLSDASNTLNGLIGKRNSSFDSTMPFHFGVKQLKPRIERSGSNASFSAAIGTTDGWTGYKHIALTISGTAATVYIDGAVHGTGTYTLGTATDAPITIGSTYPTKAEWDGQIDDVAMWSRALSATEIQSIYNANAALGTLIPEPSSYALLLGLATLGAAAIRRPR